MKIGIYGGSFSPPHNGHIKSALSFYDGIGLDKLIIVPAGVPPHKILEGDATPEDRVEMVKKAFDDARGDRRITVDLYEVSKEGKSYTCETLTHLASACSRDDEFYLLVGSDMFLSLDDWMHPEIIFRLATIVVNRRENDLDGGLFEEKKQYFEQTYGARILIPPFHPIVVSSSEVRGLLARGESGYALRRALPAVVIDYIVDHGLYGYVDACLENLKSALPRYAPKRIEHILSTEREAARMARLLCLPPKTTFILRKAALLHDVTHELSFEQQLALMKKYRRQPTEDDLKSPTVLHQFTGALVAKDLFDLEDEGCAAISCHTTGKPEMTVPEMVLCLADFIEKTRAYPACVELRRYFYEKAQTRKVTGALLIDCMYRYLQNTVDHLTEKGYFIHPQTLDALAYFTKLR